MDPNFDNERTAAQKNLGATDFEIKALLEPILASGVRRDQIVELTRKAWSDFSELCELLLEASSLPTISKDLYSGLDQIRRLLKPDAVIHFSEIDRALTALEGESKRSELGAMLYCARGLTHRLRQEYRLAAARFADAASIKELGELSRWAYALKKAQALRDLGQDFLEDQALRDAIGAYESILESLVSRDNNPVDWAKTTAELGTAQALLGQRMHGTRTLEKAIEHLQSAELIQRNEADPLEWAITQNSLGNALGTLAHRQKDEDMLEAALQAFEQALTVRSPETTPWDWATTQNNLGALLQTLGQRRNDPQLLKRSVEAYKSVLLIWTRDRAPLHWATTFNNLGTALRTLGEKRKGPRTLEQAVAAYRNALAERTRDRVPEQWAMTQNNLGAALQKLGERTEDVKAFNEAVTAYQNALKEWTQDKNPMTWAMTTANLAIAQKSLAERLADAGAAKMALEYFESVAQVFRNASHAQYYEFATEQIAKTRTLIDGLHGG